MQPQIKTDKENKKVNLDDLNQTQREAVTYCDGVSLVIAGAGSGKTRVLTYKIAYLLQNGYAPYNILALTFTNKAADEMKSRIAGMVGESTASRLWMGTFHSVFLKILRSNSDRIGFPRDFTIYNKDDSNSLIRSLIKEMGLDDKQYTPKTVSAIISMAKNSLITPGTYSSNREIIENDMRTRRPALKDIYARYWERCRRAGAMDFDDILLYANIIFRDNADIRERYSAQFRYILVDEYQDVNFAQHHIVKQLTGDNGRLCVVGDDAQSIYSFRGANIQNILNLRSVYPDCRIFKLEQNYRSTQMIVNTANSLIAKNAGQIPKHIYSENSKGAPVKILSAYSDFEEGYLVASYISEMRYRTGEPYNNFAILYRTNAQSRIFEEALRKRNIPYRIYKGMSFYQRKEIKDVIAYIRLTVNPADEEALKRVINYPARGIGATTLAKIGEAATLHKTTLWNIVSEPLEYGLKVNSGTITKLAGFRDIINDLRQAAETKNAVEYIETVIKRSGISEDIYSDAMPENISRQENIEELVSGIAEFCATREESGEGNTISDFLSEVSLASDMDEGDEAEADKVTMMTVHSAKGLEYANVFVVGLEEELFPSERCRTAQEIEEERRLLYVAITRAEKNCILTYAMSRFNNGQTKQTTPSRFLNDLDTSYIDDSMGGLATRPRISQNEHTPVGRPSVQYRSETPSDTPPTRPKTLIKVEAAIQKTTPASAEKNITVPQVGNKILHDRFGEGEVTAVSGEGGSTKIDVLFTNVGKKSLLLKFAKFEIIK